MRILTAREQVEMLSPWLRGAAAPDWERKHINKNKATDVNGDDHDLSWNGTSGLATGERSSGLSTSCSCGWSNEAGSEAAGRRNFTQHIKTIERKS